MEDEETALKKQLEETSDFDQRREIRQKIRDIRKKKLDALQSDTAANERPRRRERVKREEQTTVITKTTTSDVNEHDSTQPATVGSKIEVNYSRVVITGGNSENGVENGEVESGKYVKDEKTPAEDETVVEEQVSEVSASQFFSQAPVNGESDSKDNDKQPEKPEHELQSNASVSQEPELLDDNESEVTEESNTEEDVREEEEEEEVVLTPQVVEKIEDVDQLEKLLKEVPLNEYELRKAIRMQIRQLRVRKAMNKKVGRPAPKFKSTTPAPKGMRNERYSVDIQNKDELHKLRAELLKQREEKDKDSVGGESIVEAEEQQKVGGKEKVITTVEENTTVEPQGEGTKEVTTRTEKTMGVEETDAGKAEVMMEVKITTEVQKTGGATKTVTKTTRTTEVKRPGGTKGSSIDAMFAQRQRDRVMAKKQQQADTKNKRMAFKQQLEAQSPKVEGGKRFQTGNTAVNQLQEWCRRKTTYHEGVDIQNFTTSWANGLAMCALLNYFLPEKIPFDTLHPKNKRANWELAFNVAGEEGIEPLLELEDVMAVDVPEPKSLITYVHFIYQHFAEKQQNQKK